jgi:hypothetical protein
MTDSQFIWLRFINCISGAEYTITGNGELDRMWHEAEVERFNVLWQQWSGGSDENQIK